MGTGEGKLDGQKEFQKDFRSALLGMKHNPKGSSDHARAKARAARLFGERKDLAMEVIGEGPFKGKIDPTVFGLPGSGSPVR